MKRTEIIDSRFTELIALGEDILKSRRPPPPNVITGDFVDSDRSRQWAASASQLLANLFGRESEYFRHFEKSFKTAGYHSDLNQGLAVVKAAWNDYSKGYLTETASLIRAEVFDDFMEQAQHLLSQGYHQAAGVIAGCVLEDALRKLCDRKGIALSASPKLDGMNSELAKKGIYNTLVQKRITALADLRNKAAHGKWSEFSSKDVESMLQQTRNFVTDYLA